MRDELQIEKADQTSEQRSSSLLRIVTTAVTAIVLLFSATGIAAQTPSGRNTPVGRRHAGLERFLANPQHRILEPRNSGRRPRPA